LGPNTFYQTSVSISAFPAGITTIPSNCFNPNAATVTSRAKITSLTFHGNIAEIATAAFKTQVNLTNITVNRTTPPTTAADAFDGITLSNVDLYVPAGSSANYNVAPWNGMNIHEIEIGTLTVTHDTEGNLAAEITAALDGATATSIIKLVINGSANLSLTDCQAIGAAFPTNALKTLDLSNAKFENNSIPSNSDNAKTSFTTTNDGLLVTTVILPSDLQVIGDRAFRRFLNLTTINLPATLKKIGDRSFLQCGELASLSLPASLEEIELYAFFQCVKLTLTGELPGGLTLLGAYAFASTKVAVSSFPSGIAGIREHVFDAGATSRASISSLTINSTINAIQAQAFAYQTTLTSITVNRTTPPTTAADAFDGITLSNIDLYIPAGSVANYNNEAPWEDMKIHELTTAVWTGASSNDWATNGNWQSGSAPGSTDDVLIPAVASYYPALTAETTVRHLIMEAGAQLDLGGSSLNATSIKAKTTMDSKQWYSIGFPFDVASVYSEDYQGFMTSGNHFWLNSYNGASFATATSIVDINDEDDYYDGYIIKLPSGYGTDKTVSYVSGEIINLTKGELNFSGAYTLQANPTLADYPINASELAEENKYVYQLDSEANEYQLIEEDTFIAPFESVITFQSASVSPASKISLDTDVVTGVVPIVENEAVVATQYYNLQGITVGTSALPLQPGIYIVKTVYKSGKSEVSKIIK
jgi:hypothetical protein